MTLPRGLHLHFDPESGIAGDMTVAALVHAGVPAEVVIEAVASVGVPGLRVSFEPRQRGAYAGMGFVVAWPDQPRAGLDIGAPATRRRPVMTTGHSHGHGHGHEHRHPHPHEHEHHHEPAHPATPSAHGHRSYADIRRLLHDSGLGADARALAEDIFARLAAVEGALHGTPADDVTFHEVGAFDSIADIVGAAAAIAHLAPSQVSASAPVLGSGSVRTAHGPVAVPAPATAALLAAVGAPVRTEGHGELTTPTGAAILVAVVGSFGPMPPVRLVAQGFGAGTKDFSDRANVLRVLVGAPISASAGDPAPAVRLVQANIDDMSPQLVEPLIEALFAAGAVDAWSTPIIMKKGRPAIEVSALAPVGTVAAVERAFFRCSTTIGVREVDMARAVLARSFTEVQTRFGAVSVKVSSDGGEVLSATPELDDCRRLATAAGVPVRLVHAEASAAAAALLTPSQGGAG